MDASAVDGARPVRHGYVPAIDGLRAVAVLAVLVFHLRESFLPGGFAGVDVFFVISGFVVTQSIRDVAFPSFKSFLIHFYTRRLFRIFPLLGVVVIVTTLLFVLFVPEAWLSRDVDRTGLAAILGLSNIVLAKGNDYFSPTASYNPFTHTWSLGVEEQFYLVFPFVMYFGLRAGPRWRVAILALLTLASLAAGLWLSAAQPLKAFYLLPSRFWELGSGMLLCLTASSWKPLLQRPGRSDLLVYASAALLAAGLALHPPAAFPAPWGLVPVLGTLGLIAGALARPDLAIVSLLRSRPMAAVGTLSYSLYLWHWPVYVTMRWTVGLDALPDYLVAALLTAALSVLSYRWIEKPARDWQRGNRQAGLMPIGRIGLAAALVAAASGALFQYKPDLTLSVTGDLATWYPESEWLDLPPGACQVGEAKENVAGVHLAVFSPRDCRKPPDGGRLIVSGDSHTDHYARLLKQFASNTGREVRMYSLPGCGMVGFGRGRAGGRCADFEDRVAAEFARSLTPEDVVFLPTLRIPRYVDQWGEIGKPGAAPPRPEAPINEDRAAGLTRTIAASGARIVFEAPTPLFKAVPFRCSDWFNRRNALCAPGFSVPAAELSERRAPVMAAMTALSQRLPRVSIWDPLPTLCPGASCEAFRDGRPLFFDQDHLSGLGNDALLPSFQARMTAEFNEAGAARQASW